MEKNTKYSFQPYPRITEYLQPRAVLVSPVRREPGKLFAQKDAFGVGHEDGEAAVRGGEAGFSPCRAVGIAGIYFRGPAMIVYIAQT